MNLFEGDLVRLTAPRPEDNELFSKWTHNTEYSRLVDADPIPPMSPEAFAEWEKGIVGPNSNLFRIRTREDDKLIGFVALEVTWANQSAFLAIGIGDPHFWGKGYGTDAMKLLMQYAFQELGLYRVGLNVISANERAMRLYERLGFIREGAQRECVYRDGKRLDLVYYGILRHEWEGLYG
jgi:RimJ/RimL family protein N-acetyltransferase